MASPLLKGTTALITGAARGLGGDAGGRQRGAPAPRRAGGADGRAGRRGGRGREELRGVLDTNLTGAWRCQRAALRRMRGQEDRDKRVGRGAIVNVGSVLSLVAHGELHHTAYTTSKSGLLGLTRADANTYGRLGIRINAVCPGYVETPLLAEQMKVRPALGNVADGTSLGRLAAPDEIADAIAFLASPLASYMQGTAMVVDGGFTAQ
ncbi:hypothetical protein F4780DRAFT_783923 [Xylariomycetidae sp. FL0641]|nr:hypothetical protein F4780DRAFT_783923 [Xylariomycetidae sp. FL0641]